MSFPVTEKPEFWKGNGAYLLATANAWPPALLRTREGTGKSWFKRQYTDGVVESSPLYLVLNYVELHIL
jgi:hypothetical protein